MTDRRIERNHLISPLFLLVPLMLLSAPLVAETIAVAIFDVDCLENSQQLLLALEEGVMEHLFATGHIVFDLDLNDTDDAYRIARAIVEAKLGGAAYVVLYGVSFRTVHERGLLPETITVTVYEVDGGRGLDAGIIDAEELLRYDQLSSEAVSLALGAEAARVALGGIMEVEVSW